MLAAGACPFSLGAQADTETNSPWAGYTGEGDYKQSAGNTGQVMQNAHAVRDGKYDKPPTDVAETGEAVWIWRLKMDRRLGPGLKASARYVNIRKSANFGMDTPNVGPDLPTVLTLFVDFAKPGLPRSYARSTRSRRDTIHFFHRL